MDVSWGSAFSASSRLPCYWPHENGTLRRSRTQYEAALWDPISPRSNPFSSRKGAYCEICFEYLQMSTELDNGAYSLIALSFMIDGLLTGRIYWKRNLSYS
jgi:hypothetical protein